jgi:hypothetical protein
MSETPLTLLLSNRLFERVTKESLELNKTISFTVSAILEEYFLNKDDMFNHPTRKKKTGSSKDELQKERNQKLVEVYCECFKEKHGFNPHITGKDIGTLKRLAKTVALPRLVELIHAYFEFPEASLTKSRHPLGSLEFRINEIAAFRDKGDFISRSDVFELDKKLNKRKET